MNDTQKRQLEVIQHQYAKLAVQTPLKTTVEATLKQAKLETIEKRAMSLVDDYISTGLLQDEMIQDLTKQYIRGNNRHFDGLSYPNSKRSHLTNRKKTPLGKLYHSKTTTAKVIKWKYDIKSAQAQNSTCATKVTTSSLTRQDKNNTTTTKTTTSSTTTTTPITSNENFHC
eukprot:Awhi_evm2s15294